ncbi:hypothetical protein CcaverHIS631_0308580 [Cutaneotrichosporon cavernicola]|nr:hypothetical protein CcaverHIS631_0308580 [Cutaneotrichosporon cavernicola]BEJ06330.1 hypothetical protein CcaverHIS641_0308520 [Cutaneotrichosporon cavernicola]
MSPFAGPSGSITPTVLTYRHLLSPQAMTVCNPLRTIVHWDIDGAFAQFEQVRLGLPDDVPLICSQWGAIIAVNYPARAYGIKRMHNARDAKKLCPNLVVQHVATYREGDTEAGYWDDVDRRTHKVSLDPYRRESLKILAVFREMVPKGELEKASIDEAFMDLTPIVIDRLLELHTYLRTVPPDAPDGLDSPLPPPPPLDWGKAGHVVPVDMGEVGVEDVERECGGWEEGQESTWADWALCLGAEIMADVRAEVFRRLHYTCSAGIAHNKTLAKICSGWKKPNQQTILRLAATPGFMRDMDFTDIRFLGGKLGSAIAEEYSAKTVSDMLSVTLEDMQSKFGEDSIWVYNILRGIDHTEVKEKLSTKSMLASKNTIPSVVTHREGHHWLTILAGDLAVRLREARSVSPGLWPKTLVLSTRVGWGDTRSRQMAFPYTRDLDAAHIVKYARRLWGEHVPSTGFKYNNISLAFHALEKLEEGQRGIEGFLKRARDEGGEGGEGEKPGEREASGKRGEREASASSGSGSEPPAKRRLPTLSTQPKPTPLEAFLGKGKAEAKVESDVGEADPAVEVEKQGEGTLGEVGNSVDGAGWTCPRCGETFALPDEEWVARQRAEHRDWHFAADLQAQYGRGGSTPRATSDGGARKKKAKPAGIKAFFAPKK